MLLLTATMSGVQLIEHIEATGLKEEGILRIPGSLTRVKVCLVHLQFIYGNQLRV